MNSFPVEMKAPRTASSATLEHLTAIEDEMAIIAAAVKKLRLAVRKGECDRNWGYAAECDRARRLLGEVAGQLTETAR